MKKEEFQIDSDFRVFYHNILKPELIIQEKRRKEVCKSVISLFIIAPILTIVAVYYIYQKGFANLSLTERIIDCTFSLGYVYYLLFSILGAILNCKYYVYKPEYTKFLLFRYIFQNSRKDSEDPFLARKKNKSNKKYNMHFVKKPYLSQNIFVFFGLCVAGWQVIYWGAKFLAVAFGLLSFTLLKGRVIDDLLIYAFELLILGVIIYICIKMINKTPKANQIALFRYGFWGYFTRLGYRDDHYEGEYKTLFVRLQEFFFIPIFRFVALDFKHPKYTNASITIKNKKYKYPRLKGEKIELEDTDFNKIYDIYSFAPNNDLRTREIEARFILTPSFMERLKELDKKGIQVACCFQQGNVHILIKTNKDLFEFPLFKSALQREVCFQPICEIKEVLSIIDTLKLDENIGL